MPLFLNDDQYEIMLIPAAAEAPGICPPRTLGTPYQSIEYSGRQNVLFKLFI